MNYKDILQKRAAWKTAAAIPYQAAEQLEQVVQDAPGPDDIQENIKRLQPAVDAFKLKYGPYIEEAMRKGQAMRNAKIMQGAAANAAGIGIGGATAAGTYGLTGLIPGLKNSKALRLILAGTLGGMAGVMGQGYVTGKFNNYNTERAAANLQV